MVIRNKEIKGDGDKKKKKEIVTESEDSNEYTEDSDDEDSEEDDETTSEASTSSSSEEDSSEENSSAEVTATTTEDSTEEESILTLSKNRLITAICLPTNSPKTPRKQLTARGDELVTSNVGIKRRRRRQRPLTICLSHCRYELVRATSQLYGLIEVSEDTAWNIYWTDYSVSLERAVEMRRFQIVNHFPGMNEICRKDLLARNLNRMRRVFPDEYNIYPLTWCLPADNSELQAYSSSRRGKTYICKPEMGCQGRGIFLLKNIKDLNPFGRIICQVYIQKPLLIDHLKFDLRIYVLITSCDPLRVYVYKEGLARFATAKYRQPTQNNTENSYMHLTNYAVNKFSRDFIVDEEAGTKRKYTTVINALQQKGYDVATIEKQMDDVILKTILSAQPILKHHYRACFPHHDICSACFEILGFDILLDHKLKPFVIEVNHSPSFHTDTKLDHEIKEALLKDTVAMLHLKQLDRVRIEREDRKRVQDRLSSKLAEAKTLMEGKNKHKNNLKAKVLPVPPELVKSPDENKINQSEMQFKWEMEHKGEYRLIYPTEDSEKYDKFLSQNQVSLYQETAASQARANLTRAQIDEHNMKKQIEEQKRFGGNMKDIKEVPVKEKVRPESASSTGQAEDRTQNKKKKVAQKQMLPLPLANSGEHGWTQTAVVTEEELDRMKGLMQRGMLVRSLGIELQVYNLLASIGNLKKTDHDDFRKKHGFAFLTQHQRKSPPDISSKDQYTYPSNSTSNSPSRQEIGSNTDDTPDINANFIHQNHQEFIIRANSQLTITTDSSVSQPNTFLSKELTTRGQRRVKTPVIRNLKSPPNSSARRQDILPVPLSPFARMYPQGQRSLYTSKRPSTSLTPQNLYNIFPNRGQGDKNLQDSQRPPETLTPTISSFARMYVGGHQQDYVRAKLAHFHTREACQQNNKPNGMTTSSIRWQMDRSHLVPSNLTAMESQRIQDTLPPPLRTFGRMYNAAPIPNLNYEAMQQQQYSYQDFSKNHLQLPTGAAEVKAIARGGPSSTVLRTMPAKGMIKF